MSQPLLILRLRDCRISNEQEAFIKLAETTLQSQALPGIHGLIEEVWAEVTLKIDACLVNDCLTLTAYADAHKILLFSGHIQSDSSATWIAALNEHEEIQIEYRTD